MNRFGKLAAGLGALVLLIMTASVFIDEPLRLYLEQKINKGLEGYSVRIGTLQFHPIGFALDLKNLVLVRDDQPDLPIATIPLWTARVHWKALLSGRLVNDHYIERPSFRITRMLAKKEAQDEVPVQERGWQEAVESIYPLKINQVRIVDADLIYLDEANPARPLHLSHVNVYASNIRNVHSREHQYPSELFLEGRLFDTGRIQGEGHADFLADPHLGIKADILMDQVTLASLLPVTGRHNVQLSGGLMSAEGSVEYAPTIKVVNLKQLTIDGLHADYVHAKQTEKAEKERAVATAETTQKIHANEDSHVRIGQIKIVNSELGFVNEATTPTYRLYLTDAEIDLENYSNQFHDGPASFNLRGKFMGTGGTDITGILRPDTASPEFELHLKIADTPVRPMNNLLRAYGDFDVVAGRFSVYSEMDIDHGTIRGYVKPLVKDLDVYDTKQDRDKALSHKLYEGVIEEMAALLKNGSRKEVATKADISGQTKDPQTDTLQVVVRLIQNAFFEAIRPGFERDAGASEQNDQHG
jgi:uncharacterized protein DUF748